ncbi:MAG: NfeD family protein [Flammeovirgaceae bacterium]
MKKLLALLLLFLASNQLVAQQKVLLMEIKDVIDPRMSRYVKLALEEADELGTTHVVIDMDTYGGELQSADDIRTLLLDYPKHVFVYVNKNAASAGALISIACDRIYMAPGSSIGAATVVNGGDGAKAPDKYQSYMRSIMRATAEASGRNPEIAEAMVDENLYIEGISEIGQVVTFTPSEAKKHGFCEGTANSINELLKLNGLEDATVERFELGASEKVISVFLNPFISGILILVIIGGIYYELQTPGVGFPIAAAAIAAVLYFVPYYLNGLAENWELMIFLVGVILIALEVFVIPGFGIAGIAGITLTFASLILMMMDNNYFNFDLVDPFAITKSLTVGISSFIGTIVLIVLGLSNLTRTRFYERVALKDTLRTDEGYTSTFNTQNMVGNTGTAYTVLRPSGKIMIDDELYDATTRGSFIDKGETIVVISQEGTSLKVKKA